MEEKKQFTVEIERISDGDEIEGLVIKNFCIQNLSFSEIVVILGLLLQKITNINEEIREENSLRAETNELFLHMTLMGVISGELDFDKMSDYCSRELLERCLKLGE